MSITEVARLLCASGLGLVIGYLAGRGARSVAHHHEETHTVKHPAADRNTLSRITGVVVVLLAVATLVTSAVSIQRQSDQVHREKRQVLCQAALNEAFIASLRERTQAAATDREAIRSVFVDFLAIPVGDRESARKVLKDYLTTSAGADKVRAENPYPAARC